MSLMALGVLSRVLLACKVVPSFRSRALTVDLELPGARVSGQLPGTAFYSPNGPASSGSANLQGQRPDKADCRHVVLERQ